jgi:hypothetical protein
LDDIDFEVASKKEKELKHGNHVKTLKL